jgi:putative flippase GtrA
MLKKILIKGNNNSLVKYFFVGGISALVDFLIFCLFFNLFNNWFLAGIFSFFIATSANYYLSINFAFDSGSKFKKLHEIYLVFLVSFVGFFLNQIILFFFIEAFILNVYLSKIIATSLVFMWNFSARNFYIFNKKANGKS